MVEFKPVEDQLAILLRGAAQVETVPTLKAKLERSRASGQPLRVKYGIDPTSSHAPGLPPARPLT